MKSLFLIWKINCLAEMEGSLKMTMKFVVFLLAIMMSLMGSAYATRPGVSVDDYAPVPSCYILCAFNKQCCPPSLVP
jgi:hypothetical protein